MKFQRKSLFWLVARIFLGFVFAYSGFIKLTEPVENFKAAITAYEIIPIFLIPWISLIMPWIEWVAGCFLIVGFLPRFSAFILMGFSICFSFLIIGVYLLTGSLPPDCGCFGDGLHLHPLATLLIDILNIVLGYYLFKMRSHLLSVSSWCNK